MVDNSTSPAVPAVVAEDGTHTGKDTLGGLGGMIQPRVLQDRGSFRESGLSWMSLGEREVPR